MQPRATLVHVPTPSAFGGWQERSGTGGPAWSMTRPGGYSACPRNLGKATGVAPRSEQKSGPQTEEKQAVTPTNDRKSEELYTALVVTVIAITAGILLMSGMLWLVDSLGPQTGDIIAFPATRIPSVSTASFTASRAIAPDGMSCILDVQTIQKFGGSLVVESRQFEPSRIYQVHWAGTRTSGGRDDCGSSADLLLNSNQISVLIFAAGGTGVKAQN